VKNKKKQKYNWRSLQGKNSLDPVLTIRKFSTFITDDISAEHSKNMTWIRADIEPNTFCINGLTRAPTQSHIKLVSGEFLQV
jgi:hypothetical protein